MTFGGLGLWGAQRMGSWDLVPFYGTKNKSNTYTLFQGCLDAEDGIG